MLENTMDNKPAKKSPGSSFINSPDLGNFWDSVLNDDVVEGQPLINKQVENAIESNPKVAEQVTEEVSGENSPIETEAEQLNDSNPNNIEVKNEAIEQTPIEEKQEILDKLDNVDDLFNFVDSYAPDNNPSSSNISFHNTNTNLNDNQSDVDFESFVNSLEDESISPKAKETLAKYNQVMQNYPPEVANVLSDKIRNVFTNFSKGRTAQVNNMGNRFSNASELLNAEEGRTISKEEKDFWADRISKALDDPEKLLKNSRGLNLQNPETRKYFEEKYGHDWVKKQDRYSLNKSLRNQNLGIVKNAFKYLDKQSVPVGPDGKPKSKYDLVNDLINGRIDPEKLFTLPSTIKRNGARVSGQTLSRRRAALDALKTIKKNNEIRKYLQSHFDDMIDVSEYWKIPKENLLTNIRNQIAGIPEAEALLNKDNETEPKLDDKVEVDALEQAEKEYQEDERNDPLNGGIDWDKVHIYEPNEDPYYKVSDESDWINNPDYEPSSDEIQEDEDFLGPDEYIDENGNIQVDPNWKPENADEDFLGPDEQLAVIKDGLPAEIPYEPVYDTSDYNFDWEAVVETLPPDVQQELNELPEEDKEEISNLLHWRTKKLGDIKAGGSVASSDAIDMGSSRGGIGGSSRNPVGNSMLGMSLRATNANVGQGVHESTRMDSNASIASKAPIPPTTNETTGAKVGGSNNNTPRSNGSIGSGSGLLFSKVGMLKSEKSAPEIPMLGHTSNVDELNAPTIEGTIDDMKEGLIETLEAKLNAKPEVAESLGFDHKYKHWAFKGISLDELPIAQLNELTNKLENVE